MWPTIAERPASAIARGRKPEPATEPDRHEALGRVAEQHGDRPPLAERPRDVGGADVAAADGSQVDALEPRHQHAEGDRAGDVGANAEAEARQDVMAILAWGRPRRRAGAAGCTRAQKAATSSSDSVRGQSGGRLARRVAP